MSIPVEPVPVDRESPNKSFNAKTLPTLAIQAEKAARKMKQGKEFSCCRGGGYTTRDRCLIGLLGDNKRCQADNGCSIGHNLLNKEFAGRGICSDDDCAKRKPWDRNLYGKERLCIDCFHAMLDHKRSLGNETETEDEGEQSEMEDKKPTQEKGLKFSGETDDNQYYTPGVADVLNILGFKFTRKTSQKGRNIITLQKSGNIVISSHFFRNCNLEKYPFVEVLFGEHDTLALMFLKEPTKFSRKVSYTKNNNFPKISCRSLCEKFKNSLGFRYEVTVTSNVNIFVVKLAEPIPMTKNNGHTE